MVHWQVIGPEYPGGKPQRLNPKLVLPLQTVKELY